MTRVQLLPRTDYLGKLTFSERSHRSLAKDAPVLRPVQQRIVSHALVGRLDRQYVRI
jgi:hypothetical protein